MSNLPSPARPVRREADGSANVGGPDVVAASAPAASSLNLSFTSRHRPTKSTGTATTLSSQPVIVRTYSGSRPSSQARSPRSPPAMSLTSPRLPAVDDFSFEGILRAVDSDIHGTIDAIAEICARSRMSLADEYSAHLPPTGEILPGGSQHWRGRYAYPRAVPGGLEHALTAVPEASSSSEKLAAESRASSSKGKGKGKSPSAVGSLRSIISASRQDAVPQLDSRNDTDALPTQQAATTEDATPQSATQWSVQDKEEHPSITLLNSPTASKHLSLEISTALTEAPRPSHRRRSSTLTSISAWLPWTRPEAPQRPMSQGQNAETNLRDLLRSSAGPPHKHANGFG